MATTATRRVNFNVESAKLEDWQSWSAASGFTLTELLTGAMALYGEAQKAQAAGGQIILVMADGQHKTIRLPSKSVIVTDLPGGVSGVVRVQTETSEKTGPTTA